ncbi:MAG: MBL fold metallo-hydrolase [Armatimonadota bacterium]|nr:MBL fold metallo-hydrolase [Armatimonadota bacterium]
MVLRRLYDEGLAHASYLVGCPGTGVCAVIDPHRNFEVYLAAAESEGVEIVAVAETHIHADYLSGARELAEITGAQLFLSGEGGPDWQYAFAQAAGAKLLKDGDVFTVGPIEVRAVHTPGHTPEHLSFIITDGASAAVPMGALTGDFVFVGDVGRPDLLEKVANQEGTMRHGAKLLYDSLARFKGLLPDYAMLFPGHGAGSACGKALGGVPVTTVGYERESNWAFQSPSEEAFVDEVLSGQPDPPAYFATMKRLNQVGPSLLGQVAPLKEFDSETLPQALADTIVVDVRPGEEFLRGHVPGALHLPEFKRRFLTWAGSILPYDRPITLIADTRQQAENAAKRLRLIGLDDVRGWLSAGEVVQGGVTAVQEVNATDALEAAKGGHATLLDVRDAREWNEGHSPNAISIPLARLAERTGEIDRTKTVAIHCQSGVRSVVACSILERMGFSVANVTDGFDAYVADGLPVVGSKQYV